MYDRGRPVLTGLISDIKGFPGMSAYSYTKAAVRSFARAWTIELRERRIRVSVISPGHIDTPIMESLQQGDAKSLESRGSRPELYLVQSGSRAGGLDRPS